jgi:hypothetical protein
MHGFVAILDNRSTPSKAAEELSKDNPAAER